MRSTRLLVVLALLALLAGALHRPVARAQDDGPTPGEDAPPPAVDPSTFVQAPGALQVGAEAKVGYALTQVTELSGQRLVTSFAIVGETDDEWLIEHLNPGLSALSKSMPGLQGALLGLRVGKADGRVRSAFLAHPGQTGKAIPVAAVIEGPTELLAREQGEAVEVKVPAGTFAARKVAAGTGGDAVWAAREGELSGVVLKAEGRALGSYELASVRDGEATIGGRKLATKTLRYTNEWEWTLSDDPVVRALLPFGARWGQLRMKTAEVTQAVRDLRTDAKPLLTW